MTNLVLLATLASVIRCVWIRRTTWGSPWDAANTTGIALFGIALTLISPVFTLQVSPTLHRWTGSWQLEDLVGHICALAGCVCLVYNSLIRVARDDDDLHRLANRLVTPVVVAVPMMVAAFMLTDAMTGVHLDMLNTPTDNWLKTYWCVLSATKLWLAAVLIWALWIALDDDRCRTTVAYYLVGAALGVATAGACVVNAFTPLPNAGLWYLGCAATAVFATASAASWRRRMVSVGNGQSSVGA